MDTTQKVLLLISGVLLIAFGLVLYDDWIHYRASLPEILKRLNLTSRIELQGTFFSIVVFRSCLFLIPSGILGATAFISWYKDNHIPRRK